MVLSFAEALATVLEHARQVERVGGVEEVTLPVARGRVLAQDVVAPRDMPGFDRSTRDGFAVRAEDVCAGGELRVIGSVRAGEPWPGSPVCAGEAVEIMTGAPVPAGADAVVMLEHVEVTGEALRIVPGRTLRAGENVVARGSEARAGSVVLPAGRALDAGAIALAASCNCAQVDVVPRVKVAILATGDELVELGDAPEAWQIVNSNSHALRALVEAEGAAGNVLPHARDDRDALRAGLAQASVCDLVVISGGVSAGKYDLVEEILAERGAEFFFTGARIQPGRPVVFGRVPRAGRWIYFFGLPGNPVSTEVCFRLFVAPMLRALAGRSDVAPRFVEAVAAEAFEGRNGLVRFLPARIESHWQNVSARPVEWQGSGDLAANARATEYCVVEAGGVAAGERVRVLLR